MYAFKCNNCGALEPDGVQGERKLPAACHICGAGVAFDPRTGIKSYVDNNWTVLSNLTKDELSAFLAERKIDKSDIVAPTRYEEEASA